MLLRVEKSKSRTGKHAVRDIVLVVDRDQIREVSSPIAGRVKPTYVKGEAYLVDVKVPEGCYAVQVHLVRNLRGHVKGHIEVYDHSGNLVYRAVYRKLKVRYSCGDPRVSWVVDKVVRYLKLPFKRLNLAPRFTTACGR